MTALTAKFFCSHTTVPDLFDSYKMLRIEVRPIQHLLYRLRRWSNNREPISPAAGMKIFLDCQRVFQFVGFGLQQGIS